MNVWRSATIPLATLVVVCGQLAWSQDLSGFIQTAHFSPAGKVQPAATYEQARSALEAFSYLQRGSRILSNYKEPVLTRGARGISIFRDVSPAVTLVVTGEGQNVDGLGTGVIVDPAGYVLTNWHVIAGHANAVVFLKPPSGAETNEKYAYYAQIVYANPVPDLALLKLEGVPVRLPSVSIADIGQAQVAEDIHIIGHPHGQLWSYTTGVLSQIRTDYTWKYSDGSQHRAKVLQMQTAINPGNSGGPVIDDSGRVVGLVAMSEEGQNLDYAIAADVIQSFIAQGLSTRRRSGQRPPEPVVASSATVKEGVAYKTEYSGGLVVYWMNDNAGQICCLLISDTKGNRIQGTRKAQGEGIWSWMGRAANGDALLASGNAESPQRFSLDPTRQSK